MFVVVYVDAIKKYIIVPEEWIFDIDEEKLKNRGCNPNQKVRIFWSALGIDGNGRPNAEYPANFGLNFATEHPPPNDACYMGKVVHYYSK